MEKDLFLNKGPVLSRSFVTVETDTLCKSVSSERNLGVLACFVKYR